MTTKDEIRDLKKAAQEILGDDCGFALGLTGTACNSVLSVVVQRGTIEEARARLEAADMPEAVRNAPKKIIFVGKVRAHNV